MITKKAAEPHYIIFILYLLHRQILSRLQDKWLHQYEILDVYNRPSSTQMIVNKWDIQLFKNKVNKSSFLMLSTTIAKS